MENELGVQLFIRSSFGTNLSSEGKKLLPYIKKIVDNYAQIQQFVHNGTKEHLRILFPDCFFASISSKVIYSFIELFPQILFEYSACCDKEIEQHLFEENYDIAISSNPIRDPRFSYYHLFDNQRCLLVNKANSLCEKEVILPSDLNAYRIALAPPEKYNDYHFLSRFIRKCKVQPELIFCYSNDHLVQFAQENQGVSLSVMTIDDSFSEDGVRCVLFDDKEEDPTYSVHVLSLRGKPLSAESKAFIHHFKKYCISRKGNL